MAQRRILKQESKKSWSHLALLLLIMMSIKTHLSTASDTMHPGQPLAWNQTLISKNGIFELGFFTPEKTIGRDFSRVLTTMRGTRGYLAPEWISGEAITPKVDVFSYGKLLFEIVSGRRNISVLDDEICNYFPAHVAIAMSKGEDLLTLLDHKLEGSANMEELTRACTIACWCIQDDPRDRPTMGQVVKILEGVMHVGIPQIPLYFQRLLENPTEAIVFHETTTSLSSY
uniref:Protein kinase domain-containing protein n=1 Tax=Fagus sylvatica TaxID=28930 RepID=A0A2N9IH89_FAGSY